MATLSRTFFWTEELLLERRAFHRAAAPAVVAYPDNGVLLNPVLILEIRVVTGRTIRLPRLPLFGFFDLQNYKAPVGRTNSTCEVGVTG